MSKVTRSSFAKTAEPKSWQEIAALGKKVAEELSSGREQSTLRTWMAHRIAELMKQAEGSKTDRTRKGLQKECSDLILSLWRLERGSSRDNPIHELNQSLRHIADMRPPAWRRYQLVQSGIEPAQPKAKKNLSFEDIVNGLVDLGDEEQELLFALVCDGLPSELPDDVGAAEQVYDEAVDRSKYDDLAEKRKRVYDAPLAAETPLILDARSKRKRCEEFSRAIRRIQRDKLRMVKALAG